MRVRVDVCTFAPIRRALTVSLSECAENRVGVGWKNGREKPALTSKKGSHSVPSRTSERAARAGGRNQNGEGSFARGSTGAARSGVERPHITRVAVQLSRRGRTRLVPAPVRKAEDPAAAGVSMAVGAPAGSARFSSL